jgi:hypothetical protein
MRKILAAAIFVAGLGVSAAEAQLAVDLSPKDPKYNTAACKAMRVKAQNFKAGLFQQEPGTYIFAAAMPGGSLGFAAVQYRKREMLTRDVEQACMTNPPNRAYLDATIGK